MYLLCSNIERGVQSVEHGVQSVAVLSQQGLSESEIQNILQAALREAEEQNLPSDIFQVVCQSDVV